jgi:hypothetical protein
MSYVLVLLMTIDVVVVVVVWEVSLSPSYIQGGRGYKTSPRVSYNSSPRTLSLIFASYKILSSPNMTLSLGVILPPSCCNVGSCRSL